MNKRLRISLIFVSVFILLVNIPLLCACNPQEYGEFYTLQEAYEQGLISKHDLQSIAYYQNKNNVDESFVPFQLNPAKLSKATDKEIKETYIYNLQKSQNKRVKSKNIHMDYFGTYNNDCVAVRIWTEPLICLTWTETFEICGVKFDYPNNIYTLIWKAI